MVEDWKKKLSKATGRPLPKDEGRDWKGHYRKSKDPSGSNRGSRSNKEEPNRWLPLYESLKRNGKKPFLEEKKDILTTANTGLLFDKFCDVWSGRNTWKPETPKEDKSIKQQFLDEIVAHMADNGATENLLKQYHVRRNGLIDSLHGSSRSFKTTWRFVSGLGMGHVLETGFVWHRILGVPYLPGSSVKGLVRAWAEQWGGAKKEDVIRLFGPKSEDARKQPDTGVLMVFDAVPDNKPVLEVDIMNPHYGDYYGKKPMKVTSAGKEHEIDTPPADYLSPNPIFFLTVASNISFIFALALRPGRGTNDDLMLGLELLEEALDNIGAGSKTAVGYGCFAKQF